MNEPATRLALGLTGKRSHNTGVYGNKTDWRSACRYVATVPKYFGQHG